MDCFPEMPIYFRRHNVDLSEIVNHVISKEKQRIILDRWKKCIISIDVFWKCVIVNMVTLTKDELVVSNSAQLILDKCVKTSLEANGNFDKMHTVFAEIQKESAKIPISQVLAHYRFHNFCSNLQKHWQQLFLFYDLNKLRAAGLMPVFMHSKLRQQRTLLTK